MKTTMTKARRVLLLAGLLPSVAIAVDSCPDYSLYARARHEPFSKGKYGL